MRKIYFLLLGLVALLGITAFAFWRYYHLRAIVALEQNRIKLQTAENLRRQGRFDESIKLFEELRAKIAASPSDSANVYIRTLLAIDFFSRNRGDDRVRAVNLFKEIALNQSVSPFHRANAIGKLLGFYGGTRDKKFAREFIFAGAPLGLFLRDNDFSLALRRGYELAESIYPLALHEFRIAGWYGTKLMTASLTAKEQTEFFTQLKQWTEKGEANIPDFLRYGYSSSTIGYLYEMQGRNLAAIANFSDKNYSSAETAFLKSLKILNSSGDVQSYDMAYSVRFFYADLLANAYGPARKSDIMAILQPVINPPPPQFRDYHFIFFEYLRNVMEDPTAVSLQKRTSRLAVLFPEWRNFLIKNGWKI